MYAVDWSGTSTNIVVDLIGLIAGAALPFNLVGPIVLSIAFALPAIGMLALGRQLYGEINPLHVAAAVLTWNFASLMGFLSFEVSLGLALLAAALDLALPESRTVVRWSVRVLSTFALLIAHPFGLLLYTGLLVGIAFGPSLAPFSNRAMLQVAVIRMALAVLAPISAVIAFWLLAPTLPGDHVTASGASVLWQEASIRSRVGVLLSALRNYRLELDAVFMLTIGSTLAAAVFLGRLRAHAGITIVALGMLLLSLFVPRYVLGTGVIEVRLPVMAAFALGAALALRYHDLKWRTLVPIAALALVVAKVGLVSFIWMNRTTDYASILRVVKHIPPGSRVLGVGNLPARDKLGEVPLGRMLGNSMTTYPAIHFAAMYEAHAFVPALFAAPGKQPVRVQQTYAPITAPEDQLITPNRLIADGALPGNTDFAYVRLWRRCFDFIVLVNADHPNESGPLPQIPVLQLIADEGFAHLYQIRRDGTEADCPGGSTGPAGPT